MAQSWDTIKTRASAFAQEFKNTKNEKSFAQTFWIKFFAVFGVDSHRVGIFESRVKKLNKNTGFADYFWPGLLLIEHKSAGEDLSIAQDQAENYCINLSEEEHPRYLLVCDFQHFWLKDLSEGIETRFDLHELAQKVSLFGFIFGRNSARISANDPINDRAVKKLAKLHTALRRDGYKGHPLQLLLVRLLFCMFADKTGLFEPAGRFTDLIERGTKEDGSNVGQVLNQLFDELDTEFLDRQGVVPTWFKDFPFVNGKLYEEKIRTASFDAHMRNLLLDCCYLDWSRISPAVFGSMFQHVMDEEGLDTKQDLRRELGAHYTSEENIFKLINPLFLDELKAEFEHAKSSINALFEFQKKLRRLTFLDPACGCGNFLVITYRELRLLEVEVFKAVKTIATRGDQSNAGLHLLEPFKFEMVNVDQFSGIEIEEFPSRVAQVAMWLVDHQMNVLAGETLEAWMPRLPLEKSANIRIANALSLDWAELCPPQHLHYILGNPPFVGKQMQTDAQKESMERLLASTGQDTGIVGGGVLDFVAGWYIKAAQYLTDSGAAKADERKKEFKDAAFAKATQASLMDEPSVDADLSPAQAGKAAGVAAAKKTLDEIFALAEAQSLAAREKIKVAFVSTNSINQGEQVGVLWSWMQQQGIAIEFAHRTFKWSNEASNNAAVHCVIIGFGLASRVDKVKPKRLFDYVDASGQADANADFVEEAVSQINPYLVDATNVVLPTRRTPICSVPPTQYGSKPTDGGFLILSNEEKEKLIQKSPSAEKFIKRMLSAEEYLNNELRWCLWLINHTPAEWSKIKEIKHRVSEVRKFRLASTKAQTRNNADYSDRFAELRQPEQDFILIPRTSSERRAYIPIGFFSKEFILQDSCIALPNATLYHFGILTSSMHMAWVRYTCGRLKSDYRYSANIVYNNFPWPETTSNKARQGIEAAAQAVLDVRAVHQAGAAPASLATLYDPDLMPADLRKAHAALDALVDKLYFDQSKVKIKPTDQSRVALLFERYQALITQVEQAQSTPQPVRPEPVEG
ncbi:MAG: hypothetical protein QM533_07865 [Cytophagales bacterium]|nr:hypothetical protein [Cytophagales bacterium]